MSYRTFTFQQGASDKFWKIKVSGREHTVSYGRAGTAGQTKTKTFPTAERARASAEKLIAQKVKKGYSETKKKATKKKATKKKATKKKATKKKATKKKATKKKATKKKATKKKATKKKAAKKKAAKAPKADSKAMPTLLVKALVERGLHPAFALLGLRFDRPWKKLRGYPAYTFGTLEGCVKAQVALWEPTFGPEEAAVVAGLRGMEPQLIARSFDEFVSLLLAFGVDLWSAAQGSGSHRRVSTPPKHDPQTRAAVSNISRGLGVRKAHSPGPTLLAAVQGLPTKTPKRPKKRPKPDLLKRVHRSTRIREDLFPLDFNVSWEPIANEFPGLEIDDVSLVALAGDGGVFGVWHRTARDQPVVHLTHGEETRVAKDLEEFLRLTITLGVLSEELFDTALLGSKRELRRSFESNQGLMDDESRLASERVASALGLKPLRDPVEAIAKAMKTKPAPSFFKN